MKGTSIREICWMTILTILCIACFPINPFVLTGLLETGFYWPLFTLGWVVWAVGIGLVMAPIVIFPRRGGILRGKSFVHTTRLVNTGIYAVVRHPQYTGGIYAIFVTTLLWYPHWVFAVLGTMGAILTYLSAKNEDKHLIEKFGNDYIRYMKGVPRMNFLFGIVRLWMCKKQSRNHTVL